MNWLRGGFNVSSQRFDEVLEVEQEKKDEV
jgi:hypothetical protein